MYDASSHVISSVPSRPADRAAGFDLAAAQLPAYAPPPTAVAGLPRDGVGPRLDPSDPPFIAGLPNGAPIGQGSLLNILAGLIDQLGAIITGATGTGNEPGTGATDGPALPIAADPALRRTLAANASA